MSKAIQNDPAGRVKGWFRAQEQLISGWALRDGDLSEKCDVVIHIDGKSVGTARADRFDAVVQSHHGGDGLYAFAYFHSGKSDWVNAEGSATERTSGTALKSKQPRLTRSADRSAPLSIEPLEISNSVEIIGRVGSYPKLARLALEVWRGDERVLSEIPIKWTNKEEGLFRANPSAAAIAHLISGEAQLALPGLKEAGCSVAICKKPISAIVRQLRSGLKIEVNGDYQEHETASLGVRFSHPAFPSTEERIPLRSGVAITKWPAGFPPSGGTVEVSVGEAQLATQLHQGRYLSLSDTRFATISGERSRWQLSDNVVADRGHFAFPTSRTVENSLTGHVAHLTRRAPRGSLILSQLLSDAAKSDSITAVAVVRGARGTQLSLRLRDDEGILTEVSSPARGVHSWVPLRLETEIGRDIAGDVRFEFEAHGDEADDLDIVFGGSDEDSTDTEIPDATNLLVNGRMEQWPNGAGVRAHFIRGEISQGWRLFNRGCRSPVWSRAITDPVDGSLGLAIAASEVPRLLRVEADLVGVELGSCPYVLKFRVGVPPGARQLLAQQADAVADFMQIQRICLLRRRRWIKDGVLTERDDIGAVMGRKIPIGWDMERLSFAVPTFRWPETEEDDGAVNDDFVEESHHLAFEFGCPTVIAFHDVEVTTADAIAESPEQATLKVEDRNIELQIPLLESIAHWSAPKPVLPISSPTSEVRANVKWSVDAAREPVEIVIPVYNALQETLACLASLGRSTSIPILVKLIDDGSDAPVRLALQEFARDKPWIQVHSFDKNRGYTYAADFGIRETRTKWVVLLNSDTVVTGGWLEGMLACARSDPKIAFVGPLSNAATYQSIPTLRDAAGKWKVNSLPSGFDADDMADLVRRVSLKAYPQVPLLNGFCTLMRRSAFLEAGGLNHAAFPAGYGEENDLCLRVTKDGGRLAVADDVYVYHVKSASFGNARREELSKKGGQALRRLHPAVDIQALTATFQNMPALVAIRANVAEEVARAQDRSKRSDDPGEMETSISGAAAA